MTFPSPRVRSVRRRASRAFACVALAAPTAACAALALVVGSASLVAAQEAPAAAAPPLTPFTGMRVAIMPIQLWRADTTAWSKAVTWATVRVAADSAIAEELRARGLGSRWAYAGDVVRSAKRNPTFASDPYALGVARWRSVEPKPGDPIPAVVGDNLRPLAALGDTRYALIPVELRADGADAVLRLVLVDVRTRRIVWFADRTATGGERLVESVAMRVADLVMAP